MLSQDLPALDIAPQVPNLYDNVMVIGSVGMYTCVCKC